MAANTPASILTCKPVITMIKGQRLPRNIDLPVLIILAAADKMTPVKKGKKLADMIPDAELVIVDKAGHMLPSEHPG